MDKETKTFLEKQFATIDKRFDGIDERLNDMPTRVEIQQSIDDLAQVVNRGFAAMTDHMNTRFDEVDSRFRSLELALFTDYHTRIEKLEQTVEKLKALAGLSD